MPRLRKPRALRSGATIGIAAPGGPVDPERLEEGAGLLRDAGFEVTWRDDLLARRGYLAGDDVRRAEELMGLVSDPRVDAILCARGGYGCDRIVARLDAQKVRAAAKPLIGYSDVTVLLAWQRRQAGLVGFHGPMCDRGADVAPAALEALFDLLRGQAPLPVVMRGEGRGGGEASGRLVGGSLTLVAASIGTPWEIDARGAILLLEDRGELPYRVDRMLRQLLGAGVLERAAGVGLGDFSTCVDARHPDLTVGDVFDDVLGPLRLPRVANLPFGHVRDNRPWPFGARATLDADRGELRILEQGVVGSA